MNSIRTKLLVGLAISGTIGAIVLALVVIQQYGLLSSSPPPMETARLEILEHVALPLALFLILFATGAFFVIRSVEQHLLNTAKQVQQAARLLQSYDPDIENFPAELRPFVASVSDLTKRLERHSRRQEAFAADAAHELKTPLALLALELDKLPEKDAPRLRSHINALSEMVDQLLLLARSNAADISAPDQSFDPADLARRVVEDLAPAAIEAGRTLSFDAQDPHPICGLEEAVGAAVRTLVTNAIRATPEGGQITVIAGPGPSFCVRDGGNGLTAQELAKLKARGVRADSAPGGSAGLGLAIADRIAEAHGGELLTCRPEASGLRLVFPDLAIA